MIVHWSDLHVGARDVRDEAIARLVTHLLSWCEPEVTLLVITGDLTEDTRPREWARLRALLMPAVSAGVRLACVPGNHDTARWGIGRVTAEHRARMDEHLGDLMAWHAPRWPRQTVAPDGGRVVGLDSTEGQEGELHAPLARGELGRMQLARLAALGLGVRDVVLLHHHPWWGDAAHALEDADQARLLLSRAGLVLYGHQHVRYDALHGRARCIASCSTARTGLYRVWSWGLDGWGSVELMAWG